MKVQSYSDVIIGNYPHVEDFGRELKPILENEVSTVGQTNVKATIHTHWNYLPDHPEVIRFKKFIIKEVDKHFNPSVIGGEKASVIQNEFWGNVYTKGDYAQPHHHIPNSVSLVYFLKVKWYDSPLVFSDFDEKIDPEEGKYILFPSHILHHVPTHKFDHKRITISSNFVLSMPYLLHLY
ncbi:2OG-Fe(II) oxygenase family protein [bacterium]|nr:2OG-Fe(II) oxygenase family protein [bacterium]